MGRSKELFEKAEKLIPGGVNSPVRFYEPYPFFATKANGSKISDADGKQYIDYCMGYGAVFLGHNFSGVRNAVKKQLSKGSLFCAPTEQEVELARLINESIPCAEMLRLLNTGSEATMHAIRLARGFTKQNKIVKFQGCYHGAHDYVLVGAAGSGVAHQGIPMSEGMVNGVAQNTLVVPYNDIVDLEKVLEADKVAAVILEPVMANMGLIPPENNFLHDVRKICTQNGVPLIFDEVVTGFRLALGGAQEYYDITPDLATFAKAMSNGFPIAAIAGKKEIMEKFTPAGKVYQASTFAGNPISVSAALETIKTLRKKKIYYTAKKRCDTLSKGLREILSGLKFNATVNSLGSMFQLFFSDVRVRDYDTAKRSDMKLYKEVFDQLLKLGIFVPPSQFETCFISYSHDRNDIDKTLEAFEKALKKVKS